MMEIPLFKIYWDNDDIDAMNKVIRKGNNWANGPEIQILEKKLAKYVNRRFAVTFNSGTSALHAVLSSYGIKNGDEIIVPSFSFISTANAVLFVGATPQFAEIEPRTFGLDVEDVKERINEKTKAIIPMHYGGCPCSNIKALREVAEDKDLILIEDAAESLGSKINNEMTGSFGNSAMFSFCQNKIITTGEGGIIVTDDDEIYKKLLLFRSHGRVDKTDYFSSTFGGEYFSLGYNFRIPTVLAALGITQLNKIKKIIQLRRNIAESYSRELSTNKFMKLPYCPPNYFHIYQMYTLEILDGKDIRDQLIKKLSDSNIASKIYFNPIHLTYFYKKIFGYKTGDYPITENISNSILSIPIYPALSNAEIEYITNTINEFFGEKK